MDTAFAELLDREKERFLRDCTLCGACVEVCPVLERAGLGGRETTEVMREIKDVFDNGAVSDAAAAKAASCTGCGECGGDACPSGIDVPMLHKALQVELVRLGRKRHPTMEAKVGDRVYFVPDIVASMQVKPHEKRWLTRVPDQPEHKDVVVFTGCAMVMMPDKILTVSDILERLGLDFALVAGGELCCGERYASVDPEKADAHGSALVRALRRFTPDTVVFCCAECGHQVSLYAEEGASAPFRCEDIFHFLNRHRDDLEFVNAVDKTVTLHDPCALVRLFGDTESLRELLNAIPGVRLVEMDRNKEKTICCGSAAGRYFPQVAQELTRQCLEEAAATGADVLVDACQGCHLQFCPEEPWYPFEIKNCLTLLGEAMGIRYEDKVKKFYGYADGAKAMAESGENVEASSYDPDLVADLARRMFRRPAK